MTWFTRPPEAMPSCGRNSIEDPTYNQASDESEQILKACEVNRGIQTPGTFRGEKITCQNKRFGREPWVIAKKGSTSSLSLHIS